MNVTGFTDKQKEALLDLMVYAMYVDGKLASAEDEDIKSLVATMKFSSEYAQRQFVDGSFSRVRTSGPTMRSARSFTSDLARGFNTPESRRQVCVALEELLSSDNQVAPAESEFLAAVREVFQQ